MCIYFTACSNQCQSNICEQTNGACVNCSDGFYGADCQLSKQSSFLFKHNIFQC